LNNFKIKINYDILINLKLNDFLLEKPIKKVLKTLNVSNKLSLVNYDWQNISASDIMTLFNSMIKIPSYIVSVTVYPSKFGIEQMAIEQEKGP